MILGLLSYISISSVKLKYVVQYSKSNMRLNEESASQQANILNGRSVKYVLLQRAHQKL